MDMKFVFRFTYCAKSCQAFVANVRLNWVESRDDDVDTQIELDAVEQQRLRKVPLHNDLFAFERVWQLSHVLEE